MNPEKVYYSNVNLEGKVIGHMKNFIQVTGEIYTLDSWPDKEIAILKHEIDEDLRVNIFLMN